MEPITSKQRLTDGQTFTVGQRVSFIDPQSGIYTDGVVVCFHGNDQVEVGYHRSGWSDPKYNRIVSIFTLLTIIVKPPRRSRQSNEAKSRPSSKNEDAKGIPILPRLCIHMYQGHRPNVLATSPQTSEGEGADAPKGADGMVLDEDSDTSPLKSQALTGTAESTRADDDCKEAAGIDKATDMSVEPMNDEGGQTNDSESGSGDDSPASASKSGSRPASACSSSTPQETEAPSTLDTPPSPVPDAIEDLPSETPMAESEAAEDDAPPPDANTTVTASADGQEATAILTDEDKTEDRAKSPSPSPVPVPSPRSASPAVPLDAPSSSAAVVSSPPRIAERAASPPAPAPAPVAVPFSAPSPKGVQRPAFVEDPSDSSSRLGEQGSAFSSTSGARFDARPPSSQDQPLRVSPAPQREARHSPSDMMMDPWEAARVMVELRDSFLRMGAATMFNAPPPMAYNRGTWPQHAGVPLQMAPPMGMQMHMGMPMGHHMTMPSPAWQSLGMGPPPHDGSGPFKKRKW